MKKILLHEKINKCLFVYYYIETTKTILVNYIKIILQLLNNFLKLKMY